MLKELGFLPLGKSDLIENPEIPQSSYGRTVQATQREHVPRSELLPETFSSAAASSACEQCCCVTHMQLPEMLCNGRWQGGWGGGSWARQQRAQADCCRVGREVLFKPLFLAIGGEPPRGAGPSTALLLPPTATAIGEPGVARGRCWPTLAGASQREGKL